MLKLKHCLHPDPDLSFFYGILRIFPDFSWIFRNVFWVLNLWMFHFFLMAYLINKTRQKNLVQLSFVLFEKCKCSHHFHFFPLVNFKLKLGNSRGGNNTTGVERDIYGPILKPIWRQPGERYLQTKRRTECHLLLYKLYWTKIITNSMNQKFTKEKRGHPKNEINRFGMLIAGSVSTFSLLRYLNFSAKIAGSVQTFGLMSQTEAKNSIFYENLPNHLLEFSLCGEKKNRDFISDFLG